MSEPREVSRPRRAYLEERRPPALPLGAEFVRQLRRRRTLGIFIVLTVLPLILLLAFWLGDDDDSGGRGFVDLAQESGANLVVFSLFASTSFLLVVIVALFAGDPVPSEASWSTLRYLLAAPVRRERLLRQKLTVAGLSSVAAFVYFPAWTLLVGGIAYGWGPMIGPTGAQLPWPDIGGRLLIIIGYLLISTSVVGAFAFAIGTTTDAPLAAVGGAVLLMIVSAILDSITALGNLRQGLPGHYAYAWADALAPTIEWSDMITGALWSIGYSIVCIGIAYWRFLRKDITS
jgi:ABC-2 type transport system permease protein